MRWDSDVQVYFDSIGDEPIPSKAETAEMAEEIAIAVRGFRRAMEQIPGTAQRVVEIWEDRRDRGLVTGLLCHSARDDRKTDWSAHIDQKVGEVASGLADTGSKPSARRTELLREADVLLEQLEGIHLEFRLLVADDSRAGVALQRRRGLRSKAGRAAFEAARRALDLRNEVRQRFAKHNLRLVISRAKRMRGMGVRFDDLIQEGNIGLLRAIDKFEPDRGFRFATYAVWWIDQSLVRAIQNHSRTVRVPSHMYDRLRAIRRLEDTVRQRDSAPPSHDALAQELGIELRDLDELLAGGARIRSVDEPVGEDGDVRLGDLIPDASCEPAEFAVQRAEIQGVVKRGLRSLSARERKVLELRYGLHDAKPMTLRDIGRQLGLSGERARQIEVAALASLGGREEIAELRDDDGADDRGETESATSSGQ